VGLSQELAAGIEDANRRARSRLAGVGYIGTEDPGMPGAKAVGAFSGNAYFGLGEGLIQSNMVADSCPNQPHKRKSVVRRSQTSRTSVSLLCGDLKHDGVIYSGHMINRLAGMRKARGISAVELAAQVGVTRQAIYAIEAGTYMPNTAVALRLARVLDKSVEDLFELEEEHSQPANVQSFEPLDDAFSFEPGEPIQICRVGRRAIGIAPPVFPAWLPLADGIVSGAIVGGAGQAAMAGDPDDANRLLIAGCDPALSLLARHARDAGIDVILASANSARSLEWLRAGKIDIAGSHLNDPIEGGRAFSVVTFALWEEGFVVRRGNPKAVRSVADLANPRVRFVNREEGSGSRKVFDSLMEGAGMAGAKVKGSDTSVPGHLAAAWAVASGAADCCIAAGSAARRFGLDFVPLATERFELVLHKRDLTRKAVQSVLEVLNRARFRRQLETIAGYDVTRAGETLV
jgi:putative molybdopterin biosynthesis protein